MRTITYRSYYGGLLFNIDIKEFLALVKENFITKELWLKDIGQIQNNKYLIDKERMGYSEEEEFIKIYKKINNKLWLPKGHFYLVGAPFLALLAELNNINFKRIDIVNTNKISFNLLPGLTLFEHQEKIVNTLTSKQLIQIDIIKQYLPKLLESRITYSTLSVNELINNTLKHFPFLKEDLYSGFVISPARSGKTITMLALAQKLGMRTLIIVDKELIFNQFKQRIKQFTDLDIEKECRFYQGKNSFGNFDNNVKIGVGLIQTISNLFLEPDPKKIEIIKTELSQYDMVLVDEAHAVATETFMTALSGIHYEKIFGFTATKMRGDGNHRLLDYYVGDTIIRIDQKAVSSMVYDIHIYPKSYHINEPLGFIKTKRTRYGGYVETMDKWAVKKLYNDNKRNNMIVNMVLDAISKNRLIIVIGETLEHLDYLAYLINQKGKEQLKTNENIAYVINSKTKKKERQSILEKFDLAGKKRAEGKEFYPKVLLATASLLGKGFDGPYFDTLFLVAPIGAKKKERGDDARGNLVQVINRIGNKIPGKKQPICVDIVDIEPEEILLNMARSRFWNVYKDKYGDLRHNFFTKGDWSFLSSKSRR